MIHFRRTAGPRREGRNQLFRREKRKESKIKKVLLTFMLELTIFSNSSGVILGTELTRSSSFLPTALSGLSRPESTASTYCEKEQREKGGYSTTNIANFSLRSKQGSVPILLFFPFSLGQPRKPFTVPFSAALSLSHLGFLYNWTYHLIDGSVPGEIWNF